MNPNSTASLIATLLALVALGAMACNGNHPPPTDVIESPEALLEAMKANDAQIKTVRFKDAAMQYYGKDGRLSIRQVILIERPDKLRIQSYLPGVESVAGVLVCACGSFAYHDRQENVYYYGEATASNLQRFLPVGLTCGDVASVLLGGGPYGRLADAGSKPELIWDRETGRYRLTVAESTGHNQGGRIVLSVTHGSYRVQSISATNAAGERQFEYEVDDFDRVSQTVLPRKRKFFVDSTGEDISLKTDDVQLNPELPPVLFALEPPQGTPTRYLGGGTPQPPPLGGDLCAAASAPPAPEPAPAPEPSTPEASP